MVEVNPVVKENKIDIVPTTVSSSASSHDLSPQVQILLEKITSSSFNVDQQGACSNSNTHVVVVIDQTNGDTSLPHQTVPLAETCHIIQQDLLPQVKTSPRVANDDDDNDSGLMISSLASEAQHSQQVQQQTSPDDAVTLQSKELHGPCLKKVSKMGVWMSMISSGSIVSVLSGLVGDHENNTGSRLATHKIIFQTFMTLNYVAFVLGVGLFLLTLTRLKIPGLLTIVKVAMWTALGSITYALGCATYLLAFTPN